MCREQGWTSTDRLELYCRRMQRLDLGRVTVGNRGHVPLLEEPQALTAIDRLLARLQA